MNDNYGCDGDDSDYNKGEDDVEGDKNQDTMMNQGRRMGGIGGGEGMISHFYRTCGFISLL